MKTAALLISPAEVNYASKVTSLLASSFKCVVLPISATTNLKEKILQKAKSKNISYLIISEENSLYAFFKSRLLSDYMGTFIDYKNPEVPDLQILVLPPLSHWYTVPYGKHIITRYIEKLTRPNSWVEFPEFKWTLCGQDYDQTIETEIDYLLQKSKVVCVDIETASFKDSTGAYIPKITCVSFCFILLSPQLQLKTYCIPLFSPLHYLLIKKICEHPIPKCFQNGKFDISHLFLYKINTKSWFFDTLNLSHARYSEMPKRLDFIAGYYLRKIRYWKDDNSFSNMLAHYEYNARDAYNTARVFITQLKELPDWAKKNYTIQFPLEHVCLYMNFTGLPINQDKLKEQKAEFVNKENSLLAKLRSFTYPSFNPNSPKQVLEVLNVWTKFLVNKSVDSTNESTLKIIASWHVWLDKFIQLLLEYRETSKYLSTYLNAELLNNKLFYSIEAAGTDTGRMASRASSFSYISRIKKTGEPEFVNFGTQIQNIPQKYKELVIAPKDWCFAEIDYSQSEARCTAYLSQDLNLIDAVENSPDFHCHNASKFFGIPFEQLYDIKTGKKLNKEIRDLAKRVNHGANYNMGPSTLLQTMGISNVVQAQKLLNLPKSWTPIQVCEYLLKCFDVTYPRVRGDYYEEIRQQIKLTNKLVSPLGWTRYCFGDPSSSKVYMNAYAAHGPQNLSVAILNIGMLKIFNSLISPTFRLLAQIHDSLLFMYKDSIENRNKLMKAKELLTISVKIHNRTMTIPPSMSFGKSCWAELKD